MYLNHEGLVEFRSITTSVIKHYLNKVSCHRVWFVLYSVYDLNWKSTSVLVACWSGYWVSIV